MPVARRIEPGDIPQSAAARRLGLSLEVFEQKRSALEQRGFPKPDPTTELYDLDAIEAWRRARHPHLFGLTGVPAAVDARTGIVATRLKAGAGG